MSSKESLTQINNPSYVGYTVSGTKAPSFVQVTGSAIRVDYLSIPSINKYQESQSGTNITFSKVSKQGPSNDLVKLSIVPYFDTHSLSLESKSVFVRLMDLLPDLQPFHRLEDCPLDYILPYLPTSIRYQSCIYDFHIIATEVSYYDAHLDKTLVRYDQGNIKSSLVHTLYWLYQNTDLNPYLEPSSRVTM